MQNELMAPPSSEPIHEVKSITSSFLILKNGMAKVEVLECAGRNYNVGDLILFKEWVHEIGEYTGESILFRISWIIRGIIGLTPGYCVVQLVEPGFIVQEMEVKA